jgi:hypothetical protein
MDEKNNDRQLVEEIRALRADLRRYAVIAMWLFLGVSVCGFVLFSNHASERVNEGLGPMIPLLIVIGLAWKVGLILRSELSAKPGRKGERAESAILSRRTSGANRKP